MKEIVQALKDVIESRIKNRVLSSIVIAWALWNWRDILTFLLSSKQDMKRIVIEHQFSYGNDFIIPVLIGLTYATIFQIVIYAPAYIAEKIDNCISKLSSRNALEKLKLQRRMNDVAITSDYDFQKSVKMEKLKGISEKYDDLVANNQAVTAELNMITSQLDEHKKINDKLIYDRDELTFQIIKANESITKILTSLEHHMNAAEFDKHPASIDFIKSALEITRDELPSLKLMAGSHRSEIDLNRPRESKLDRVLERSKVNERI
ncbi:hypothetical protein [Aeromonas salmonicida]